MPTLLFLFNTRKPSHKIAATRVAPITSSVSEIPDAFVCRIVVVLETVGVLSTLVVVGMVVTIVVVVNAVVARVEELIELELPVEDVELLVDDVELLVEVGGVDDAVVNVVRVEVVDVEEFGEEGPVASCNKVL